MSYVVYLGKGFLASLCFYACKVYFITLDMMLNNDLSCAFIYPDSTLLSVKLMNVETEFF